MDDELFLYTGVGYGNERLRGKFNRLRGKYRLVYELWEHNGIIYDLASNTEHALKDV